MLRSVQSVWLASTPRLSFDYMQRNLKKMKRKLKFIDYNLQINTVFLLAIRGPKILQDAWDKKKTLRQKCVLVVQLNPFAQLLASQLRRHGTLGLDETSRLWWIGASAA